MNEIYTFLFCISLGIASRVLFMAVSLLAKRTNLLPVTIVLDMLFAIVVGASFTLYIIFTGTVLAPYMFAAALAGYFLTYRLTQFKKTDKDKK